MSWNLNSERPIYAQIVERIQHDIVSGAYTPGEKLPSVRDLAAQAAVNPNTMQKALAELERMELVHAKRTSGRFITEDWNMIQQMKEQLATAQVVDFLQKMTQLGYPPEDTVQLIEKLSHPTTPEKEEQP